MGYKENKRRYVLQYQKENYASVVFHLRKDSDLAIIAKLNEQPNKSSYIRDLILKDIANE